MLFTLIINEIFIRALNFLKEIGYGMGVYSSLRQGDMCPSTECSALTMSRSCITVDNVSPHIYSRIYM
jgi:hypothetical protein